MNILKSLENLRLAECMDVEKIPLTRVFCKGVDSGSLVGYFALDKAWENLENSLASKECAGLGAKILNKVFTNRIQG